MRTKTVRGQHYDAILATNLRKLIEYADGGSVNAWAKRYGFQQTTVNRVANGSSDASVGQLIEWSEGLGCAPEDLLRSSFDPGKLASLPGLAERRILSLYGAIKSEKDRGLAELLLARLANDSQGE